MDISNNLELHYYFSDKSHVIDSLVRNKCEAELLAIVYEVAASLGVDTKVITEASREGGFKEVWKLIEGNSSAIMVVLQVVLILVTTIPLLVDSEKEELEKELIKLQIEESKHNLKEVQKSIKNQENIEENVSKATEQLKKNLKIIKRKSNFYSTLSSYPKVTKVGVVTLNDNFMPTSDELLVDRKNFRNFILSTNKLRAEEVETEIEIISPVLKEGKYKWKGIYNNEPITFDMLDSTFKESVLIDDIPFKHGTSIVCVLRINRELDEVGDIKIKGYSVTTVIDKIDGVSVQETPQGKKYRYAKKQMENQGDLF